MSNGTLESYIERLTTLEREKKQVADLVRDLKAEAKSTGFDPDALAEVVRRVLWDEDKVAKAKEKAEAAKLYAEKIGQLNLF
jgi:uncharacterized protein (UPF0335 family)